MKQQLKRGDAVARGCQRELVGLSLQHRLAAFGLRTPPRKGWRRIELLDAELGDALEASGDRIRHRSAKPSLKGPGVRRA